MRRLFPVLSAISLGLAIGVAGLWNVSYWRVVGAGFRPDWRSFDLSCSAGALRITRTEGFLYPQSSPRKWSSYCWRGDPWLELPTNGWWFGRELVRHQHFDAAVLWVPLWLPTLLFLILPVVWLRHFRRLRRRQKLGLCLKCGYDLWATPERCPECGTMVRASHA